MKVLVCGGRNFSDHVLLWDTLDTLHDQHKFDTVIHGGAKGADIAAGCWAIERSIPVRCFPANWERYGNRAGPIRNREMLSKAKPDLVIAFAGGAGTADMISAAKDNKTPVLVIDAQNTTAKT